MALNTRTGLIGLAAGCAPAAAQAECLGDGCYSGLGVYLAAAVAIALAILAAFIYAIVVVYRRKGGKAAGWFVVASIVGAYLLITL